MKKSPVIWLTGMSGSGKSALSNYIKTQLKSKGYKYKCLIIDGDSVRGLDKKQLGFGVEDVLVNNMRIAHMCNEKRKDYDFLLVPVISPYEEVRKKIRKILEPNFHLIYIKADISSLKNRDPKGLYAAADRGEINDLVGYSDINPYDEPITPELTVLTSINQSIDDSFEVIFDYLTKQVF